MKTGFRTASLTLAIGMGLILVTLLLFHTVIATADTAIDLTVEMKAPTCEDAGAADVVNRSYDNLGGQLVHRHGMTLTVPPGAVSEITCFQLGPLFTDTHPVDPPGRLLFANRAFELNAYRFGEPVGTFSAPLTITMNYSDTDVAGLKRETLRLWTREGPEDPWQSMGEPVRTMSGTLAHTTTHLSEFALFGEAMDAGQVDLEVRGMAPVLVDIDSTYVVNVSYANLGWVQSLDNWVRVTLPEGTQFSTATHTFGEPRPPDEVDGQVLTWSLPLLVANSAWGHILVEVTTDEGLAEGTILSVVAEIGGSAADSNTENNMVTMTSTVQDMGGAMKRVHVRQAMPADVLEYSITVDLPGKGGGSQLVTLIDTLPISHQVRFLGWSGSPQGVLTEGHRLRWQGEVKPGDPVQLSYRLGVEGDVPPGEIISNVATLSWQGRQMQLGPVATVISVPHGVMGLGPGQGGQLVHRHGVTLTVPPGAVSDTIRFQLGPLYTDTHPVDPPGGLFFANRAFELNAYRFGEPVGTFSAPLTITMNYSDTDVAGLKRETLRLWTREGPEGPWQSMGEPVRSMSGTLAYSTTHLSQFALFGEGQYSMYLPLVKK